MESKIKNASVKVMLSYDYSHFEASMSKEDYLEAHELNIIVITLHPANIEYHRPI